MNSNSNQIVTPYSDKTSNKKEQVTKMFDSISGEYDFFNRLFSLGIDIYWRKVAINKIKKIQPKNILDIATGTGDFAFNALKLNPNKITGIDISSKMLEIAKAKYKSKLTNIPIEFMLGDSEDLPFESQTFDAITVGFGVRNFEHLEKGLAEIHRVLKPNGLVAILEPAYPTAFPIKQLFEIYFNNIVPAVGKLFAKDQSAYRYLSNSVQAFPNGLDFLDICKTIGFNQSNWYPLTFGTCSLYILSK